jgi:hypothetical protein
MSDNINGVVINILLYGVGMVVKRMILVPLIMIFSVFFSYSEVVFGKTGFEYGADFEAHSLKGNVTVYCFKNGRNTISHVYCRAGVISPSGWQYFLGDKKISADKLYLKNTQANGKIRKKKMSYDSSKYRTKRRVNLWTDTLTQRSLLDYGENEIEYAFLRDGSSVKTGSFTAFVKRGEDLECRSRTYHLGRAGCQNVSICRRYFQDENDCRYE